jgi:uncharacterized damage-inducible protein DinB
MKDYFKKIYNYNIWANTKLINSLKNQQIADTGVLKLLSHIVLSEQIWMLRLKKGDYQNKNFWRVLDINECETISNENYQVFLEFIDAKKDAAKFTSTITYKNSKGIEFTNTIEDVLTHVAFHSSYHRGQIAREIRKLDREPVLTDYIAYVRESLNH